jgi:hypothetical protein
MLKEIWIPIDKADSFKRKYEKMQQKALMLEVDPPAMKFTSEFRTSDILGQDGQVYSIGFNKVIFSGEPPTYNNWEFLALIDHDKLDGKYVNIVKAPIFSRDESKKMTLESIIEFSSCPPNCGHCNTQRDRSCTIICRNTETNEIKQVGTSCVDDFIGKNTLEQIMLSLAFNKILSGEEPDEKMLLGKFGSYRNIKLVLAVSNYVTKTYGFNPSSNETDTIPSTKSIVIRALTGQVDQGVSQIITDYINRNENEHLTIANSIIENTLKLEPKNSFLVNCINICKKGIVNLTDNYSVAVIASLPNIHQKNAEKALSEKNFLNEYFSTPKERGALKLRLIGVKNNYSHAYPYTNYYFSDDDGRHYRWKTSTTANINADIGKSYLINATIKDHENYKGKKTTLLTRCSLIEEIDNNKPAPAFKSKKSPTKKAVNSTLTCC